MKGLREFFIVLLCVALVSVVTSLAAIVGMKDMFQGSLMTDAIKEMVKVEGDTEEVKEINEAIDKVTSYQGTNEVVDSFLQDITNSKDELVISDKTFDLLLKAIEDNKDELIKLGADEKEINEAIADLKNPDNREKMTKEMNESYKGSDVQISGSDINALKTVASIVAPSTIRNMIISIVVIISLIVLLAFSPYKWIRPVSISSIVAGFNVLAFYFAFDFISKFIVEQGSSVQIDPTKLAYFGYPLFFGGIAGVVLYCVLKGMDNKNHIDVGDNTKKENVVVEKTTTNETTPTDDKIKYCSNCGAALHKGDNVCGQCGAPIE